MSMLRYILAQPNPAGETSLTVVAPASLEAYQEVIRSLHLEFPECWHLIQAAEDQMRADEFVRVRRELTRTHAQGELPLGITFDPHRSWHGVF